MGNATSTSDGVVFTSIEIGAMIIDLLHIEDKINVYAVEELRKFFAPRHAKSVILSRTTFRTANTLHKDFIIQMGSHIQELNLSCVKDLTPDVFTQTINQLKNLRILDVTYTSVFLHHLVETGFPKNLENLAINFQSPRSIYYGTSLYCICDKLKKIHFVAFRCADLEKSYDFFKFVPSNGLEVKITLIRDTNNEISSFEDEQTQPSLRDTNVYFKELTLIMVNGANLRHLNGIGGLDFNQLEYIFMMNSEQGEIIIYTSPLFRPLFTETLGTQIQIKVCQKLPYFYACSKFIIKLWNKDLTRFDAEFSKKVLEELKDYFPQFICMHSDPPEVISVVKAESDWYCIDINLGSNDGFEKKLQYLPPKVTLTSTCKKDRENVGDATLTHSRCLSPELTLKNITFIALNAVQSDYTDNFFIVLFQCCELQTLDLLGPPEGLEKAIHLANNLKNYRQDYDDADYELIFATLSRCPTLENIHICDAGGEIEIQKSKLTSITSKLMSIISNCKGLYSIFIEGVFAKTHLAPMHSWITYLANDHTSVVFEFLFTHNPFSDTFDASELFQHLFHM